METQQLELDLAGLMQNAIADPVAADLRQVWRSLEPLLEKLSDQEQLQVAGKAIDQLAEVHQVKAKHILGDWQERYNDQGPVMSDELLAGLVQQTMHLDISTLVRQPKRPRTKPGNTNTSDPESVVGVVEKETMLAFIDAQEEVISKEQALAVAYEEDISGWAEAIGNWLQRDGEKQSVSLVQLYQGLEMPLVVLWLGLLLGGFELEQRGEFYESEIWVKAELGRSPT